MPIQTLVKWTSVGRATTASVNLTDYVINNGNQLTFQVRATDPAGNVGKSSKSTPIVVDTTAPTPGRFTQISVIGVNDGKNRSLHTGNGVFLPHKRCGYPCMSYMCRNKYSFRTRMINTSALSSSVRQLLVCACNVVDNFS